MTFDFHCAFCGSDSAWRMLAPTVVGNWPQRNKCKKCGTLSYACAPESDLLDHYYKTSWGTGEDGRDASGSTDMAIASDFLTATGWTPDAGLNLDFGAGRGYLSRAIQSRGGKVMAFEPYGSAPELLSLGIPVVRSFEAFEPTQTFDTIFCMEVLEHLSDPCATLKKLHSMLSNDGKLILSTPNAAGAVARFYGHQWREANNPTHMNLLTMTAIRCMAKTVGFRGIHRHRMPMAYGKTGLRKIALGITQLLCIDGGLRVTLKK